ncbi:MAG: hypothetical protein AB7L90_00710 [Hyphomicrobiaceae bacterium]
MTFTARKSAAAFDTDRNGSSDIPIFTDWQPLEHGGFGDEVLEIGHSLAETGLFTDDVLSELIERTPRADYHVSTMDPQSHDPLTRREGVMDGLSGTDVLEAIRRGYIWLNLRNVEANMPAYRRLLDRIYAELQARLPDQHFFKQKMTILISSPSVRVGYHCDVPGQTLWQVRGRKRVWVYPNTSPFLPPDRLESIVLGEAHEVSLKFQDTFDAHARVIDLEPGRMVTWPHNAPHRIVNHDCLNVSVTTEHWTPSLRNAYAVNYANGLLRRSLGLTELSQSTAGLASLSKIALAAGHKLAGIQKGRRHKPRIDFRVDPASPNGFCDIPAYEIAR